MTICFVGGDVTPATNLTKLDPSDSAQFLPAKSTPVDLSLYNEIFAWLYEQYYAWAKRNPESLEWHAYCRVVLEEFETLEVEAPLAWFQRTLQRQLGVDMDSNRATLRRRAQGLRNLSEYLTVIMPGRVWATRKFLEVLLDEEAVDLGRLTQSLVATKVHRGQTAKVDFVRRCVLPALFDFSGEGEIHFARRLDEILHDLSFLQAANSYPGYFLNEETGERTKRVTTPTTRRYVPTKKHPAPRLIQIGVWGSTWSAPATPTGSGANQTGGSTGSLIQKPPAKPKYRPSAYVPKPVEGEAEFAYLGNYDDQKLIRSLRKPHFYARFAKQGKYLELVRYLSKENQALLKKLGTVYVSLSVVPGTSVPVPPYLIDEVRQMHRTAFKAIEKLLAYPQRKDWLNRESVAEVCEFWAGIHAKQQRQAQQIYQLHRFHRGARLTRETFEISAATFDLTPGAQTVVLSTVLSTGAIQSIGTTHLRGYGYLTKTNYRGEYTDTLVNRTGLVYALTAAIFLLLNVTIIQLARVLKSAS